MIPFLAATPFAAAMLPFINLTTGKIKKGTSRNSDIIIFYTIVRAHCLHKNHGQIK